MKKLSLITIISVCSLIGFSQKSNLQPLDTPGRVTIVTMPEERISKLEAEIATLKLSQTEMQKQLSEMKMTLQPTSKKKKLIINRMGSKQVNWTSSER